MFNFIGFVSLWKQLSGDTAQGFIWTKQILTYNILVKTFAVNDGLKSLSRRYQQMLDALSGLHCNLLEPVGSVGCLLSASGGNTSSLL